MKKALFLLILGSLASFSPAWSGEYEDSILKGNEYAQKKHFDKAIVEYKKAYAAKPTDQKVNLLLALTYATLGELDEALKFTQAAIDIEPSYSGYNNAGLIYANKGDYPKAAEAYKKALEYSPQSFKTWYHLGLVYASDLKFQEAIESYEKVLKLNPKYTDAFLGLGSAYYWSGDREGAMEQVRKLKLAKDKLKAQALEDWIKNTDQKRERPTPPPPPAPAAAPAEEAKT